MKRRRMSGFEDDQPNVNECEGKGKKMPRIAVKLTLAPTMVQPPVQFSSK